MNLLLDTNILIWLYEESPVLKAETRAIVTSRANQVTVSIASIWEMSIKQASGKLKIPDNLLALLELNNMQLLPIDVEHAFAVGSLPPLHGDPFDRMLVAQAMLEDLTIMTHDKKITAYSVSCLLV